MLKFNISFYVQYFSYIFGIGLKELIKLTVVSLFY